MDDAPLLEALTPAASELLNRHLSQSREWYPHDHVPWDRVAEFGPTTEGRTDVPQALRSALFVNLLTEDNLPYYHLQIDRMFGVGEPWTVWAKRWTAEEGRHSIVIRDYITVSGMLDPVELERARMAQVSGGQVPQPPSAAEGFVYVALQELATRISHRNTGVQLRDDLDDAAGYEVLRRVAVDENHHHLFYRDLVTAALEIDPSGTMLAIESMVSDFAMPGVGIIDFDFHAAEIAKAGIYDFVVHHDAILEPVVLRHWAIEDLTGLSDEAERAREKTLKRIAMTKRAGLRMRARFDETAAAERVPVAG
jgi:acyl-[acyl-carrier-protein] desaturase